MKHRMLALAILLALFASMAFAPAAPVKASHGALTVPVTGTIPGTGGTFTGTFEITHFVNQSGGLFAVGNLSGTLTDALGNTIGTVTDVLVRLPVTSISGTCEILHLELGPLDLDLLGLQVHLDKVVLDITAQSGQGNLLGNLLCAIASLLDHNVLGTGLTRLLNQLLGALA